MIDVMENIKKLSAALDAETASLHPVHEVIQIGYELLLPINLISKTPSDGLCGKTDEDNLGFTYAHLDAYIMYGTSGIEEIDKKIASMHDHNLHKLNPMPAYGTTIF